MSFVRQFPMPIAFRCSLYSTSESSIISKPISKSWQANYLIHLQLTLGGVNNLSKCIWLFSMSSRHNRRSNWDAARCSPGNKFGLHVMSSKNAIVCERNVASCSKSWKCFDTQWLFFFFKIENRKNHQVQRNFRCQIVLHEICHNINLP